MYTREDFEITYSEHSMTKYYPYLCSRVGISLRSQGRNTVFLFPTAEVEVDTKAC